MMMGPVAIQEQAGTLLSIIADSAKYKDQVKELRDLADVAIVETGRNNQVLAKLQAVTTQVANDRAAIEQLAKQAAKDRAAAEAAQADAADRMRRHAVVLDEFRMQQDSTNADRTRYMEKLNKQQRDLDEREASIRVREAAINDREAQVKAAQDDLNKKLKAMKAAIG